MSYAAQGGPSACARCRDPSPGWHGVRKAIRINSIRIPQEDTRRAPLSGFPQVEAHSTREHHTSDDSISYPDMLFGSLTKVHKPCYVIPTACHSPRFAALRWCVRMPILLAFRICLWQRTSKLRFFMFLSFPLLCHGFQRTLLNLGLLWWSKSYQNTKTQKLNTILLELIARVLNMPIELKGNNYYSKVFKRVNYKLWNNTFWAVITQPRAVHNI